MNKVKKIILAICVVCLAFLMGMGVAEIKKQTDKAKIVKNGTAADNISRSSNVAAGNIGKGIENKDEVKQDGPKAIVRETESNSKIKQEEPKDVSVEKNIYPEKNEQNLDDNTPEEDPDDIIEDPEMEN